MQSIELEILIGNFKIWVVPFVPIKMFEQKNMGWSAKMKITWCTVVYLHAEPHLGSLRNLVRRF